MRATAAPREDSRRRPKNGILAPPLNRPRQDRPLHRTDHRLLRLQIPISTKAKLEGFILCLLGLFVSSVFVLVLLARRAQVCPVQATVKVDNLPTAQRLTSGSVPSQQELYAGPALGTGHSLLAKEQRRYLVNVQTGCAHPTNDGVTMTCGHKRLKVCTLTSSIAGFELCAFARGRPQE